MGKGGIRPQPGKGRRARISGSDRHTSQVALLNGDDKKMKRLLNEFEARYFRPEKKPGVKAFFQRQFFSFAIALFLNAFAVTVSKRGGSPLCICQISHSSTDEPKEPRAGAVGHEGAVTAGISEN